MKPCAYCGDPVDDGGRWCENCSDAARFDTLAPIGVSTSMIRKLRRHLSRSFEDLDALERTIRSSSR